MRIVKILFVIAILFNFSEAVAENTFVFSTEPQSIAVSELSGAITIHANTAVTETTYILLTSNSNTGQFYSSKTSAEPIVAGTYNVYISTNNSNRTVYYKDSTAGNFIISADILAKDKTKITTVTQSIIVGSQSQDGEQNTTTTNTTTTTETQTVGSGNSYSNSSAHSSPVPLSNTDPKMEFEISSGRDRLTSVGSKIIFQATQTRSSGVPNNSVSYFWSFGDGTTAVGNTVTHSYKFAGEYSVITNGSYSDSDAVSRIKVKVIEPKISLVRISGGVEVANNSGSEINLEDWTLSGPTKTFIFPKDTLIPNGKKVIFDDLVTGINSGSIKIENPLGMKYAEVTDSTIINQEVAINTDGITKEIKKIEETLAILSPKIKQISSRNSSSNSNIFYEESSLSEINKDVHLVSANVFNNIENKILSTSSQFANVVTVFEAPEQRGLISSIFSWPIAGINYIKNLFVEK